MSDPPPPPSGPKRPRLIIPGMQTPQSPVEEQPPPDPPRPGLVVPGMQAPQAAGGMVEEDTVQWDKDFLAGVDEGQSPEIPEHAGPEQAVEPGPLAEHVNEDVADPEFPPSPEDIAPAEEDFLVDDEPPPEAPAYRERPPELRAAPSDRKVILPRPLAPMGMQPPRRSATTTLVSKDVDQDAQAGDAPVESEEIIDQEAPPIVVKTESVPTAAGVAAAMAGPHRPRVSVPQAVAVAAPATSAPRTGPVPLSRGSAVHLHRTGAVHVPATGPVRPQTQAHELHHSPTSPLHNAAQLAALIEPRSNLPVIMFTLMGLIVGLLLGIYSAARVPMVQNKLGMQSTAYTKTLVREALAMEREHTEAMLKEFFSQNPINYDSEMTMWRDETGKPLPELAVFQRVTAAAEEPEEDDPHQE